jgi:hypothetical protein
MQFSAGITALLHLALKAADDVVEGKTTLAGLAHTSHTTHAAETLRLLNGRTALRTGAGHVSTKVERARTRGSCVLALKAVDGTHRLVRGFGASGGGSI